MNGQVIPFQNSVTQLVYDIDNTECKKLIDQGISDLITCNNFVWSKFGFCDSNVRNYLFRTYCTSYYGLQFLACVISILKDVIVTGENVFDVFGMFLETHCRFLEFLYGVKNIEIQLLSRFLNFYLWVMNSENCILSICAKVCVTSLSVGGQFMEKPKYSIKKKARHLSSKNCVYWEMIQYIQSQAIIKSILNGAVFLLFSSISIPCFMFPHYLV